MKRILKWLGLILIVALAGAAIFVGVQAYAFKKSMNQVYDVAALPITRSSDPRVLERGKHMTESVAGCATRDCHGSDLGGGKPIELGPVGVLTGPNITPAGRASQYSDGELARLIVHGLKRDGRSVTFMPSQDMSWLPDEDLQAIVSYVRTVPPIHRADGVMRMGLLAQVLDRRGLVTIDVARRIDHQHRATAPTPAPTAAYGAFMGRLCVGCHGEHLSGGPIPGAPPSLPVPLNITKHDTGIGTWSYEDFNRLLTQGIRKNGKKVDPFMPIEGLSKMNETEKRALWTYLETVSPAPFGNR